MDIEIRPPPQKVPHRSRTLTPLEHSRDLAKRPLAVVRGVIFARAQRLASPSPQQIVSSRPATALTPEKMAARPTVSVFSAAGESSGSVPLPAVFSAPIRIDVVQAVHSECR